MKLTIIHPDGIIETEFRTKVDLKVLQDHVGGLIETVPHFNKFEGKRCVAYINEEGMINDLHVNTIATNLWKDQLGKGPFRYNPVIYGPLVIKQKD